MVDWLINQVEAQPDKQLYYNVILQKVMETRFPPLPVHISISRMLPFAVAI